MKFRVLSRSEFNCLTNWPTILEKSNSYLKWDDICNAITKARDTQTGYTEYGFYINNIVPMHTKLGQYLAGVDCEVQDIK
jgi:hypothetical protein